MPGIPDLSSDPDAGVATASELFHSRTVALFAGAGAIAALAAVLLARWRRLADVRLDLALGLPFAPVTDFLLLLLCAAALVLAQRRRTETRQKLANLAALVASAVTLLVAGAALLGVESRFERWITPLTGSSDGAFAHPMSALVAGALLGAAIAVLLGIVPAGRTRQGRQVRALLALVPVSICVAMLVEYSARAGTIDEYPSASVAILTAASLAGLGLAALRAAGTGVWPLSLFSARHAVPQPPGGRWFAPGRLWPFVVVMLAILVVQSLQLRGELLLARRVAEHELAMVADLKAREVARWVHELDADGEMIRNSGLASDALLRYLAGARDPVLVEGLEGWMLALRRHGGTLGEVTLLDARGTPLRSTATEQKSAPSTELRQALGALGNGTIRFWTVRAPRASVDSGTRAVVYNLLIPLPEGAPGSALAGALLIKAEAAGALFEPASRSGPEVLLVADRGDEVEVLSRTRDRPDSVRALFMRTGGAPMDRPKSRGFAGFVVDRDYRGVPTVVALSPVVGTPWSVAAKEDQAAILLPLVRQTLGNEAVLGVLLVLAGLLAAQSAQRREERAMREELRLSARFEQLMRQAGDIILLVGLDGRIVEANEQAAESFGYSLSELQGMHVGELQPHEVAPAVLAFLGEHLRTFGQVNADVLSRRKDGSIFPGEVNARRVEFDGDTVVCCFIRDVTDRVRDSGALRSSEERWKFALEGAGHGVWDLDVPTARVQLSPLANALLGGENAEVTSGSDAIPSNVHPEDESRVRSAWKAFFDGDVPTYASEYRIVCRDGSVKWVHTRGLTVSRDAEGRPLRMIGTHADITEAKSLMTELQQSHDLLAALAAQVPGALFQLQIFPDGRTRIPFANETLRDVFEVSPDEVREDASALFARMHPDDSQAVTASIFTSARHLQPWDHEFRVELPKQGVRWRQGFAQPQRLDDGSTLWHGFVTDITDRRRLEAGVNEVRKMEAIGQLAGGIAHDFNNLLTAITGYTYLADDSLPADALARGDIRQIRLAAERAGMMTKKLLSFAYQDEIEVRPLRLDRLLFDLEGLLRRLLGEHIEIVISTVENLWPVRADQGELEQVFINLGVNSRDAMPDGGLLTFSASNVTLDSEAGAHLDIPAGEYVELSVSDTGCGMTEEVLRRVFEPFYTTKEKGRGTGLGLAIVWGAVQRLGAHLRVSSTPGVGTTFRFFLQRTTEDVPSDADDAPDLLPRGTERILLVEDDALVRGVVSKILERSGYAVLVASGPHAAIDVASDLSQSLDLLLTDIVMPLMNGRELAERVRSMRPEIPVVLMSGYSRERVSDVLRGSQGYSFLAKPFAERKLLDCVAEALGARSAIS